MKTNKLILIGAMLLAAAFARATETKPNILVILADENGGVRMMARKNAARPAKIREALVKSAVVSPRQKH